MANDPRTPQPTQQPVTAPQPMFPAQWVPPPQPADDDRDATPALNDGELLPDDREPLENEQSPQMPNVYRHPV
jgi:hypothetical protein